MKKNKEETAATIRKLIDTARLFFTEKGYADTALEDIVHEAKLTRGALYHHFGSKKGLFLAVLEVVQQEVADRVEAEASQSDDVWEQLLFGCRAFVAAAVEPARRRILLIDGPAVLGWDAWRGMDARNSMRHLQEQLQSMQRQGHLQQVPIEAMTHFLSGALNESALWIAQMPEDSGALEDTMNIIARYLNGLKG